MPTFRNVISLNIIRIKEIRIPIIWDIKNIISLIISYIYTSRVLIQTLRKKICVNLWPSVKSALMASLIASVHHLLRVGYTWPRPGSSNTYKKYRLQHAWSIIQKSCMRSWWSDISMWSVFCHLSQYVTTVTDCMTTNICLLALI